MKWRKAAGCVFGKGGREGSDFLALLQFVFKRDTKRIVQEIWPKILRLNGEKIHGGKGGGEVKWPEAVEFFGVVRVQKKQAAT